MDDGRLNSLGEVSISLQSYMQSLIGLGDHGQRS